MLSLVILDIAQYIEFLCIHISMHRTYIYVCIYIHIIYIYIYLHDHYIVYGCFGILVALSPAA